MINDSFEEDANVPDYDAPASPRDIQIKLGGNSMFNRQPSKGMNQFTLKGDEAADETQQNDFSSM